MKKLILITGILFGLSIMYVNGQQAGVRSNTTRQVNQQARIREGKRSGELNKKETARLQREQRRIAIEKRIAAGDGTVTPKEKAFLRREQNRASRHIYRERHDVR
jgi:hypothetical protein